MMWGEPGAVAPHDHPTRAGAVLQGRQPQRTSVARSCPACPLAGFIRFPLLSLHRRELGVPECH